MKKLGTFDVHSEIFSFSDFSTCYDHELGGHCWKYLASLEGLLPADHIVRIKLLTEEIETTLSNLAEGRRMRTVNIDPGFLNGWQVVLASVKNYSHRLYMGQGVFCEVTLLYRDSAFHSLPWTYRDYLSSQILDFLKRVRAQYARQIQSP